MNLTKESKVMVDVFGGYCGFDEFEFVLNERAHGVFEAAAPRR